MRLLFKICRDSEWKRAIGRGVFMGSEADHADGFIHLSTAHQVRETAAKHFAGQTGLVLVALAESDLENLKWEVSRGGDKFPHVYGEIPTRLARWVKSLPLEEGAHVFPEEVP